MRFLHDTGIEALNEAAPQNKEEQQEVFWLKKEIVDLVEKVTIDQDRTLHIHIRLNLLRILEEDANKGGPNAPAVSIQSGGIIPVYTVATAQKLFG